MPESSQLDQSSLRPQSNRPWLIAAWPGMGQVAISAGYYLMAKLNMHLMAEFSARDLFEVDNVSVREGLIQPGRLPRSRLFVWNDPLGVRDVIVFIGEAQPPLGKYAFCHRLIEFAKQLSVQKVITFAAMGTNMHPNRKSRVFGAATDREALKGLKQLDLQILQSGEIGGLNGVLLGAASEADLSGACLLGEIPQMFAEFPFPAAALAVLHRFLKLAEIELDLTELEAQAKAYSQELTNLLTQVEESIQAIQQEEDESEEAFLPPPEPLLAEEDEERVERLFAQAAADRSKAYELKQELDRLQVFRDYEDRFLDLFQRQDPPT